MKRTLKVLLVLLAAAVLNAAIGRAVISKRAAQSQAAAPRDALPLELAPGDLVTVQAMELTRALEVSGSLKAVRTAVVKAKAAAEVRKLNVHEGDTVRAGQVLGRLDATEYAARLKQAQHQAASASARLQIAETTLTNKCGSRKGAPRAESVKGPRCAPRSERPTAVAARATPASAPA